MARGYQLGLGRRVDAVIAGTCDRRRGDAEMDFFRTGLPKHLYELAARRPPDEGVADDDDALSCQHLTHRIELQLDLGVAGGLRGVHECAADVVVADQRVLQLEARLLRESERHGIRRVWHREDAVGVRRGMLRRQLAPQGPAHAIDRPAEDRAVGPREVHQLEDAASMWLRRECRQPIDLRWRSLNAQEFAGLELAHRGGADQIERARLGGDDVAVAYLAEPERSEASRVDNGVQRPADGDDQRIGAFDALQRVEQLVFGLAGL